MEYFPTKCNLSLLVLEVAKLPYWLDGSGAYMSVKPTDHLVKEIRDSIPLMEAIDEISVLKKLQPIRCMVNRLPPDVTVPVHTDTLLENVLRYHLPVQTNRRAFFWGEEIGEVHFPLGIWCGPIPFDKLHNIWNNGATERIHLVVDLLKE